MITFLFVLSVLVLFHELGHFLAARYFGVTVESFSIGFGPRLLGFVRNGTDFKVCLLPLGGYVKMAGQTVAGAAEAEPGELESKPRWQRLVISAMGPIFNFVLAVGLLTGLYVYRYERAEFLNEEPRIGYVRSGSAAAAAGLQAGDLIFSLDTVPTPTWRDLSLATALVVDRRVKVEFRREGSLRSAEIEVPGDPRQPGLGDPGWAARHEVVFEAVLRGSPAEAAGLRSGDRLVSIDGEEVAVVEQAITIVGASAGRPLAVAVEREGARRVLQARAVQSEDDGVWRIGVRLRARYEQVSEPLPLGQALRMSANENYAYAGLIFRTLAALIVGDVSVKALEGPVGIYEHTKDAAAYGIGPLIQLMALISVNLGIVNLVPIPVLDGGHILLLLVESLLRRDVSTVVRERFTQVGLAFIVLLFGLVMYNDLMRQFFPE